MTQGVVNVLKSIQIDKKYSNKLNWFYLSINPCLTISFINKHINKFNWEYLSINPCLNIDFINKKDTFKRIANRYEEYYKKKQEALDNAVANADDTKLNDSIKQRYRTDFKKDRK